MSAASMGAHPRVGGDSLQHVGQRQEPAPLHRKSGDIYGQSSPVRSLHVESCQRVAAQLLKRDDRFKPKPTGMDWPCGLRAGYSVPRGHNKAGVGAAVS